MFSLLIWSPRQYDYRLLINKVPRCELMSVCRHLLISKCVFCQESVLINENLFARRWKNTYFYWENEYIQIPV